MPICCCFFFFFFQFVVLTDYNLCSIDIIPVMLSGYFPTPFFLKKYFIYLFILAAPGLSCGVWGLHFGMQDL